MQNSALTDEYGYILWTALTDPYHFANHYEDTANEGIDEHRKLKRRQKSGRVKYRTTDSSKY